MVLSVIYLHALEFAAICLAWFGSLLLIGRHGRVIVNLMVKVIIRLMLMLMAMVMVMVMAMALAMAVAMAIIV